MLTSTRKCVPQVTRKSHANDSQMSASTLSLAGGSQVSCNCISSVTPIFYSIWKVIERGVMQLLYRENFCLIPFINHHNGFCE